MLEFIRKSKYLMPAVLAVVLAAPVTVLAEAPATQPEQSTKPSQRHHGRRMDRMRHHNPAMMLDRMHETINSLDLTTDQKTQVDALFTQAKSDFEAMRQKWEQDKVKPRDRMDQGRDFMKDLNKKVEAILTDQQKEALKEKRQKWAQNREGRRGPGMHHGKDGKGDRQGPPAMMERMHHALDQLNLTEDQKQQVKAVMTETHEKLKALRDESDGDREAMREKGRKIMEDARTRIMAILTPEQREKLKEMRRSNREEKGRQDAPAAESDKT